MTLKDRLLSKVEVSGLCWNFTGATRPDGYGVIGMGGKRGKTELAHRASWSVHVGPVPNGMFVCHTCDNPKCINPDHLFLGTVADNNRDKANKGRNVNPAYPGRLNRQAKLSEEEVLEIREDTNSHATVAEKYGVSKSMIHNIRARKNWAHI